MIAAVLAAYILAVILIRRDLKNGSPDAFNDAIQTLTIAAFVSMAWVMWSRGGVEAWPSLLPFTLAQILAHAIFLILKHIGARGAVRRIDGVVTTLATTIFTGVAMVALIPRMRGRSLEVLGSVCFGLPLVFALPSLVKPNAYQDDIYRAATASHLVYSRGTSDMFQEVEFIHNRETGARCGVYVDKDIESKTIYVAFSGTDSKVDWIRTNFDVEAERYAVECGQNAPPSTPPVVHKGFLKAWKSIEEPVWDKISQVMLRLGGSGKVVVCGHSLGGAMATIAGADLFCKVETGYQKSFSVITFGSPRVGNASFRDMFDSLIPRSVRVVTVYDPIPKTTINDFVHVKQEYLLGGGVLGSPHNIKTYIKSLQNSA
jgi:hypothetical protein